MTTPTTPMTPDRFAALCAAEGGDLSRWPEDERAAAQALLDADPAADPAAAAAAREALRACAPLDEAFAALRAAPPPPLPAGLAERLARDAARRAPRAAAAPAPRTAHRSAVRRASGPLRFRPFAAMAAPMAASVALGLWLGAAGALDPYSASIWSESAAPGALTDLADLDLLGEGSEIAMLFGDAQ